MTTEPIATEPRAAEPIAADPFAPAPTAAPPSVAEPSVGEASVAEPIEWADFERVDLRVGTVRTAELNPKARRPAYVLTVDLGELGVKTSSAQLTVHYTPEQLIGRQVLCVCNFVSKRIAGVRSEVLVTGAYDGSGDDAGVVLAGFDHPVPNGTRLS